jgi:hypothetical protein
LIIAEIKYKMSTQEEQGRELQMKQIMLEIRSIDTLLTRCQIEKGFLMHTLEFDWNELVKKKIERGELSEEDIPDLEEEKKREIEREYPRKLKLYDSEIAGLTELKKKVQDSYPLN